MRSVYLYLILLVFGLTDTITAQNGKPVVYRALDLVGPGETAILTGQWSGEGVKVWLRRAGTGQNWRLASTRQADSGSVKVQIPQEWPMDVYECRVAQSGSFSKAVRLNAADVWWTQGDGGAAAASPGGWLRIFGKALHFKRESRVRLRSAGRTVILSARSAADRNGYALSVPLSPHLVPGDYALSVHNGYGGANAWEPAGQLKVQRPEKASDLVVNVRRLAGGAAGEGFDWTPLVKSALSEVSAAGGGTVYFPQGRYKITEGLNIPPRVRLRGETAGLVSLYWPPRDTALQSLITGTDDFSVSDLTIYTSGVHRDVVAGDNRVRVERVRIRADAYYRHDYVGNAHAVKPVTVSSREMGAAIRISGDQAVVTDCEIYHSASAIELYHTHGGLIARNKLNYGKGPMQLYGISQVIIEENTCSGASLWASGFGISLYGYSAASYHVYFARNRIRQNYGGDREAVTLDGHGTAYLGQVRTAASKLVELKQDSWWGSAHKDLILLSELQRGLKAREYGQQEWHGITMFVLGGRGAGQYRNLIAANGKSIELESPWTITPDSTSVVSIGKFQGRMLFIGNQFEDAGTSVQLYPPNFDCIVAENQLWRTQSTNAGAELSQRTFTKNVQELTSVRAEPSWYNQFLHNRIHEGNGWGGTPSVLAVYGHHKMSDPARPWLSGLKLSYGHVLRGNELANNAQIVVEGAVTNMVIEKNSISRTDKGIVLQPATGKSAGIWMADNHFTEVGQTIVQP